MNYQKIYNQIIERSNGNLPKACREGRILKGYRWRYQN